MDLVCEIQALAGYSAYIQWVVAIFMILFGVNFNAYYFLLMKRFKHAFDMEEVKGYFLIIAAASALIFINIYEQDNDSCRYDPGHVDFPGWIHDDIYRLFYGGF